ncbi:MAG: hypothetical protein J0I90_05215 [Nitrosospira sp.]|nr:hypothetical protein [Nitrosospira sp.]MBN9126971.1 hypothetical protein [Nitrosospira sp.]
MKHLQKRPVTAGVCIRQYFRKIADRLVSMNTEEQTDRGSHRVTSRAMPRESIYPGLRNLAGKGYRNAIRHHRPPSRERGHGWSWDETHRLAP